MYATPLCLDNRCLLSYRPSGSSKLSQHLLVKFSLSAEQPVAAIERVIMGTCRLCNLWMLTTSSDMSRPQTHVYVQEA